MRPLLLGLVLAVSLSGCGLLPERTDSQAVVAYPQGERDPAPAVVAETLAGDRLAMEDLDGVVVVNFWASWCGPCREEAPFLNAVADAYEPEGVSVVGVNTKDGRVNAQSFVDANALAFPSWFDPDQAIAAGFGGSGPVGLPTTIVLDADHRVAVRFFGGITGATLGPVLDRVLAETPN